MYIICTYISCFLSFMSLLSFMFFISFVSFMSFMNVGACRNEAGCSCQFQSIANTSPTHHQRIASHIHNDEDDPRGGNDTTTTMTHKGGAGEGASLTTSVTVTDFVDDPVGFGY